MLVRIRCKTGNFRFELQPSDDIQLLLHKILEVGPEADASTVTLSNQPRGGESLISPLEGPLSKFGITHGDLLFVNWKDKQSERVRPAVPTPAVNGTSDAPQSSSSALKAWETTVEDPVDSYWEKHEGKIYRQRDAKMCRHGAKAMCDYCMPLEPYNEAYQQEHKIKHLSFHAHLRKLDTAANKQASGSSFVPPLEEPDYRVAIPCSSGSHASWPNGICSKCQPSAVTLQLQSYRMVDHVEYAHPSIIDQFLNFWRATGNQRFGYLLGRYEAYDQVPMGVKAVVEAIHEPPQAGDSDGIEVNMTWDDLPRIEALAATCGMKVVGMIYTDLVADPDAKTNNRSVICKRHTDSFFLSSQETIFSARMQKSRPNPLRFCATGKFASKFVTCVVTGNEEGEIEVKAYQASDQAMALVEADLIEASVDPAVVRVKNEKDPVTTASGLQGDVPTVKRYVPDVFYRYKNEYKIEVKESAKPCFPVDYLLLSLTHGFPDAPTPLFASANLIAPFAIENRQGLSDQSQDAVLRRVAELARSLPPQHDLDADGFEEMPSMDAKGKGKASDVDAYKAVALWVSDWHLLAYIQAELVGKILDQNDLKAFLAAALAAGKDESAWLPAVKALCRTPGWQTLVTFGTDSFPSAPAQMTGSANDFPDIPPELLEDTSMDTSGAGGASADASAGLTCPHCTYVNPPSTTDCEVCSLPIR